MGRNGETKRTWSICSGTTRFFWPQLWNSLANHLIGQILFSHWYKIQSYHRIQDVGRIKREDEYKVHGLQPACWALSLSRLFQAWSSKEKGDKQTVYSSLEPGERLPLHNQNHFLSPDEQLPLSPCLVLLGGTECVSYREIVWPVCAPGSILWGMILIWAPNEIVLSWEKQHVDIVIALPSLVREWLVMALVCKSLTVKTGWPLYILGTYDCIPKGKKANVVWMKRRYRLCFFHSQLCLCPLSAPEPDVVCLAFSSWPLSHLCSSKNLNLHLKRPPWLQSGRADSQGGFQARTQKSLSNMFSWLFLPKYIKNTCLCSKLAPN